MANKPFKDKILADFELEELSDIANQGCGKCCPGGYIYYHETTAVYDLYKEEIWDCLEDIYESLGCKTPLELIASFNGARDVYSDYQFKNLLVWFYIEEIARNYVEETELAGGVKNG